MAPTGTRSTAGATSRSCCTTSTGRRSGQAPSTTLRVLVAEKQKSVAVASAAPFKVRDGVGATHTVNGLSVSVGPGLKVAVDGHPFATALPGPLVFSRPARRSP